MARLRIRLLVQAEGHPLGLMAIALLTGNWLKLKSLATFWLDPALQVRGVLREPIFRESFFLPG